MATAMIDWDEDQEQELTAPMETPASARLVESHHQELSAEIERAKSMVGQSEIDGEVIYSQHTLDRAVAFLKMRRMALADLRHLCACTNDWSGTLGKC